ncbi:tetratricopeptide repeat protein [Streptomyces sp. HC307]|uniref:tetratricopeptide repeat protein n=1 Tax=Streptomyces flavusporus TaxID=3385496 RepID=UPI003917666D
MARTAAVLDLLADAYRDAALAGANMHHAVDVLEHLRGAAHEGADLYRLLEVADARAGEAVGKPLLPVLDRLRDRFIGVLCETLTESLRSSLDHGPDSGRREWLRCWAEALMHYREPVLRHLLTVDLPIPFPNPSGREEIARCAEYWFAERWEHVHPLLEHLLEYADVNGGARVNLLVTAGELELYWRGGPATAKPFIDTALEEGPCDPRAWEGLGEYRLQVRDVDGAEDAFERAVELAPDRSHGYRGLGNCAAERGNLDEAARHYLRGIAEVPHAVDNYRALIELYGHPQLFEQRKGRLDGIAAQAVAVEPPSRYGIEVLLGSVFRQNDDRERAHRHLRAALALRPDRFDARVELSALYRQENKLDSAESECEQMLLQDPEYWSAHYELAMTCEQRRQFDRAIRHYEKVLAVRPAWAARLHTDIAMTHLGAGRYDRAAAVVLDGLRVDPADDELWSAVSDIALGMLTDSENAEGAEELLSRARNLRGDDFETAYQQRRGRMYHDAGMYREAAAAFERAIDTPATGATDTDCHRNAAHSYTELGEWNRARSLLDRAYAIDGDQDTYEKQLARLCNAEANSHYEAGRYAEAAEGYRRAAELVPDDAVLHSNLALALESGMKPGGRGAALREAITALTRAEERSDDPALYKVRRSRLERLESLVQRFGELVATAPTVPPVQIMVANDLVPWVNPAQSGDTFMHGDVPAARERVGELLGFPLPGYRFSSDPELRPGGYVIHIHGVEEGRGAVVTGSHCLVASVATVVSSGVDADRIRPGWDPVTRGPCCWVAPADLDGAWSADETGGGREIRRLTDTGFLLAHVSEVVRRHGWRLLGTDEAERWLTDAAPKGAGAAVDDVSGGLGHGAYASAQTRLAATRVLRALARDGITLAPASRIVALLEGADVTGTKLAEAVRTMRRALRDGLPGNEPGVIRRPVPEWVEDRRIDVPQDSSSAALDPAQEHRLAIVLGHMFVPGGRTALVTAEPALRPYLQRLIEGGMGPEQGGFAGVLETVELSEPRAEERE